MIPALRKLKLQDRILQQLQTNVAAVLDPIGALLLLGYVTATFTATSAIPGGSDFTMGHSLGRAPNGILPLLTNFYGLFRVSQTVNNAQASTILLNCSNDILAGQSASFLVFLMLLALLLSAANQGGMPVYVADGGSLPVVCLSGCGSGGSGGGITNFGDGGTVPVVVVGGAGSTYISQDGGVLSVNVVGGSGTTASTQSGNWAVLALLDAGIPDAVSPTVALNGVDAGCIVNLAGLRGAGMTLGSGTLAASLTPEVSFDNGTTWNPNSVLFAKFFQPGDPHFNKSKCRNSGGDCFAWW